MRQDRLQQGERRGSVIPEEGLRMNHRLARLDQGGKVEYAIKWTTLLFRRDKKTFNPCPVGQFPFHKLDPLRQQVAPAVAQIVKRNGLMALAGQPPFRQCNPHRR